MKRDLLFAGWILLIVFLLELFARFDWEAGPLRAILILMVGMVILAPVKIKTLIPSPTSWLNRPWLAWLVLACLVGLVVITGLRTARQVSISNTIPLDQGENSYRAYLLLKQGMNPYGRSVILDPIEYEQFLRNAPSSGPCFELDKRKAYSNFQKFWATHDPRFLDGAIPEVKSRAECRDHEFTASTLGFKYGPSLLLLYSPFLEVFGKPGIFVAHMFYLVAFVVFVSFILQMQIRLFPLALISLAVVMLLPSHLRNNGFANSASDIIPTLLAVGGFLLIYLRTHHSVGAVLLALGLTAKILPALLFLPLVLRISPRSFMTCALASILIYVPFLIWDLHGTVNNIVLFNMKRGTDSTALLHFVPDSYHMLIVLASVISMGLVYFRFWRSRFEDMGSWIVLVVFHVMILFSGKIFHNNYLVWMQCVLGFSAFFLVMFSHKQSSMEPARH